MKKVLLFIPVILLIALITFVIINSKTDNEVLEFNQKKLEEIKKVIPNTKRIVIGYVDTKEKKDDGKYIYNYYKQRYVIFKEITDDENVEMIKNLIMEYEVPTDTSSDISLYNDKAFLLELYDDEGNKIAETNLATISTSKKNRTTCKNPELSSIVYDYYEQYAYGDKVTT